MFVFVQGKKRKRNTAFNEVQVEVSAEEPAADSCAVHMSEHSNCCRATVLHDTVLYDTVYSTDWNDTVLHGTVLHDTVYSTDWHDTVLHDIVHSTDWCSTVLHEPVYSTDWQDTVLHDTAYSTDWHSTVLHEPVYIIIHTCLHHNIRAPGTQSRPRILFFYKLM